MNNPFAPKTTAFAPAPAPSPFGATKSPFGAAPAPAPLTGTKSPFGAPAAASPFGAAPAPATANPFAPKAAAPAAGNIFGARPATLGAPAATGTNPFGAVRPAVPAANAVTIKGDTVIKDLPEDLRKQLVEMNVLIHNFGEILKATEAKPPLQPKIDSLRSMVSEARHMFQATKYEFGMHDAARNAVAAKNIAQHNDLSELGLRARVAQSDSGVEEFDDVSPFFRKTVESSVSRAASVLEVLAQLESLELPVDMLPSAESAARTDRMQMLRFRDELSRATDSRARRGMDYDDDMGARPGGALEYDTTGFDERELVKLQEVREKEANMPTLELIKQVLIVEADAIAAVAGGPINDLSEKVRSLKAAVRNRLRIANGQPKAAVSDDFGMFDTFLLNPDALRSRDVSGKYSDPFDDRTAQGLDARRKAAEKRELRIPRSTGETQSVISVLQQEARAAAASTAAGAPGVAPAPATNMFGAATTAAAPAGAPAPAAANPFAAKGVSFAPTTAAAPAPAAANPFGAKPATTGFPAAPAPAAGANPFAPKPATANPFGAPAGAALSIPANPFASGKTPFDLKK